MFPIHFLLPSTARRARAALLRRAVLAGAVAAGLAVPVFSAFAQAPAAAQAPAQFEIDMPAQPLGQSLNALSRQTGVAIAANADLLGERRAPALNGRFSLSQALDRLLQGSGLEATARPDGIYLVRAAATSSGGAVATLGAVNVFATLEEQISVGSKSAQSLRETPKSVSIMTRERIESQNLTTLQEVLIQTTGVTAGAFSPLDTFYYSRGMRLQTYQFDGGAPAFTADLGFYYTPDTATLERVELLRGVDGMHSGAGEPGGVINLVRKRPGRQQAIQLDLSAGTWDSYRATIDATGPLALDGRLRGRGVISYTDRGYFQRGYTSDKKIAYGVLEFDATDTTLLTLGANYEDRKDDGYPGWAGVARYSDGGALELPREYNVAPDWARWHTETKEVFAKVEQQYGQTGVLKLDLTRIEQDTEIKQALAYGPVDRTTGTGSVLYGSQGTYAPVQYLADLSASGSFEWFGRSHRYTIGADYAKLDGAGQRSYDLVGLTYADGNALDYWSYDPNSLAEPESALAGAYPVLEQGQRGYYATLGLQLADPLRLTLGGRYGEFRYHRVYQAASTGATTVQRYSDSKFIPSAALSYDLSARWTAYLSYGETFKVQANLLAAPEPGTPLEPMTGDNLELGVKGDVFDGVTAAVAVYRLTRSGQGALDPAYASAVTNPDDGSACCYLAQGEVRVEGLDVELSGAVAPGWQVFGGYTYSHTEFEGTSSVTSTLGRTPMHQLKLWTTYQLPGRFGRWTVNGGVVTQSDTSYSVLHYGGMTLWNAGVRYAVDDTWSLGLSGDNLTDKDYWQPTGTLGYQNVRGTPRSVTFAVHGRW